MSPCSFLRLTCLSVNYIYIEIYTQHYYEFRRFRTEHIVALELQNTKYFLNGRNETNETLVAVRIGIALTKQAIRKAMLIKKKKNIM